jgi:hypothetical protein
MRARERSRREHVAEKDLPLRAESAEQRIARLRRDCGASLPDEDALVRQTGWMERRENADDARACAARDFPNGPCCRAAIRNEGSRNAARRPRAA